MSYPPLGFPAGGHDGHGADQTWSGYGEAPALEDGPNAPGPGFPYGAPAGYPPAKKSNRYVILAPIAGGVVFLLVVAIGTWWGFSGSAGDGTAITSDTATSSTTLVPSSTTAVPSTTSSPFTTSAPLSDGSCEGFAAAVGPQTPAGWQTVTGKRGLSYDVPADWEVKTCSTIVGWEVECPDGPFGVCPGRVMTSAAELPAAQCLEGTTVLSGIAGSPDIGDIHQAVKAESELVAGIYTSDGVVPTVALSPAKELMLDGRAAVQVVATVTGVKTGECTGASARHYMVATTSPAVDGTVVFIVSVDEGMSNAPDPTVIDELVGTLRAAPKN